MRTVARMMGTALAVAAAGFGAAVALYAAGPPLGPVALERLEVRATAVALDAADPKRERLGRLRYAGGLALASADGAFGGLSGLAFAPACGRLLAVSDTGVWVALQPRIEGARNDGRLTGIDAAWLTGARDADGAVATRKAAADSEALAWRPGGEALVSFEQDHRVRRYAGLDPCRPETLTGAASGPDVRPAGWAGWPANGGAESLARSPDGRLLLAVAEQAVRGPGGREALLTRGLNGPGVRFTLVPAAGLDPTDAVWLDGRRVLMLNRAFSPLTGAVITLMEYDLGGLPARAARSRGGLRDVAAVVRGRELARLAPRLTVDNLEGLALERRGGRTWLWMVSDDNFNPAQRTILLRFELEPR